MYEVETKQVHFVGEKMFEDLDEARRYAAVKSQEADIDGYLLSKDDLSDKAQTARRNVILDFLRWREGLGHVAEEAEEANVEARGLTQKEFVEAGETLLDGNATIGPFIEVTDTPPSTPLGTKEIPSEF